MTHVITLQHATLRQTWLRRGSAPHPRARGRWHPVSLSDLGNAAARETFTTATLPFAAAWTDLFQSMIAASLELRWLDNGPGVGRDARIAYSSLFGRYMARAYLTRHEDVRVLVPLDEARHMLRGTRYAIRKHPPGRGLEADWIGLDGSGRLVIAEAKGSFDQGVRSWSGPHNIPDVLHSALGQAKRTALFKTFVPDPLPSRCWAVASRWANEENGRCPTLLAWDSDEGALNEDDHLALAGILHRADVEGVLTGLGHSAAVDTLNVGTRSTRLPGDVSLRIGGRAIEPGFAAVLGPIGSYPLRASSDLDRVSLIREMTPNIALASLSSRYAAAIIQPPHRLEDGELVVEPGSTPDGDARFATQAGLTVAWPMPDEHIGWAEE